MLANARGLGRAGVCLLFLVVLALIAPLQAIATTPASKASGLHRAGPAPAQSQAPQQFLAQHRQGETQPTDSQRSDSRQDSQRRSAPNESEHSEKRDAEKLRQRLQSSSARRAWNAVGCGQNGVLLWPAAWRLAAPRPTRSGVCRDRSLAKPPDTWWARRHVPAVLSVFRN